MSKDELAVGDYFAELVYDLSLIEHTYHISGVSDGVFGFFSGLSIEQAASFAEALTLKARQIDNLMSVELFRKSSDVKSILAKLECAECQKKLSKFKGTDDEDFGGNPRLQMAHFAKLFSTEFTQEFKVLPQPEEPAKDRLIVQPHGIQIDGETVNFVGTNLRRERLFDFFKALVSTQGYQTMKDFSLRTEDIIKQPQEIQDLFDLSGPATAGSKIKSEWFRPK